MDRQEDVTAEGPIAQSRAARRASKRKTTARGRASRLEVREEDSLALPDIAGKFQQRIGSSVIDEFVNAHGPADVLRELVQNEFDGQGADIGIRFGSDMLTVTGTGRVINAKGWRRLSVIMGTGEVLGDSSHEIVEAKENGIGSKNFGLRSLFYFGDRIHVRSNGQMAVLDLQALGALRLADPISAGAAGVRVQVPYRTRPLRKLQAFTPEREAHAIDEIASVLFPTLVKLALEGKRCGIRSLTVISERTGRELHWRQRAERFKSAVAGVAVTRRAGRLATIGSDQTRTSQSYEELEFSRSIEIPTEHADLDFPGYYRSGNRARIALSLPVRGKRLVLTGGGHAYYPLRAAHGRTGAVCSVSAPFQLDGDRTRPITSDWNDWLFEKAADLAADLIGTDWFRRFGADAYAASLPIGPDEPGSFRSRLAERLKSAKCWPSQVSGQLAAAASLVVADDPALEEHLAASQYLDRAVASRVALASLAAECGCRQFTVNSLVRLRCAGAEAKALSTKLSGAEANYHYKSYPGRLLAVDTQVATATSLTMLRRRLSKANREDLGATASTLAADGQIRTARELVIVTQDMWEACPAPVGTRLHPALNSLGAISGHCEAFDLGRWVVEAADRAANGTITPTEHEAVYRHIFAPETRFPLRTLAILRRSPVVQDEDGNWVKPEDLALLPSRDAVALASVVNAPGDALRRRPDLIRRLRIRRKVIGEDFIRLAAQVEEHPHLAEGVEALLRRNMPRLTQKIVTALTGQPILRTRAGNLASPANLHLPTIVNLGCLDDLNALVAGDNQGLYAKLGCRKQPSSTTLLEIIERCRTAGTPPPQPFLFYPALVQALREEGRPAGSLAHDPILYIEGRYATPHISLATSRAPRCLQAAVPIYRAGGVVAEAYQALGASVVPGEQHWHAFFAWIDARATAAGGAPLSKLERVFLTEAYQRRGPAGLPADLSESSLCLLSEAGTAHSLTDLRADGFVENDYPELAAALTAAGAGIAFADRAEHSRIFFRALGIDALSRVCGEARVTIGAPAAPPNWFHSQVAEKALALLHGPDLAQAVNELAYAHQKQVPDFHPIRGSVLSQRLMTISRITFVREVLRTYRLRKTVSVPTEAAVDGDQLALRPPRFRSEYDHVVAMQLGQLAGAKRLPDIRVLASAILPLLGASSNAEMLAYLARLGIQPRRWHSEEAEAGGSFGEDDAELTRQEILRELIGSVRITAPLPTTPSAAPTPSIPKAPQPTIAHPTEPPPLPAVSDVRLSVEMRERSAPTPIAAAAPVGGGRFGGYWTPRTPAEIERDRKLGTHGEELVYRLELERVRNLGHANPEEKVIWTSRLDPGADHDIQSIGEDGGPIWIEVKSTTGQDGRFEWSIAEFEKALHEGNRYQLWRIYERLLPPRYSQTQLTCSGLLCCASR